MKKRTFSLILAIILVMAILQYQTNTYADNATTDVQNNKPKLMKSTPSYGEKYFDPERLNIKLTDSEEKGYYIQATFDNRGNNLKLRSTIPNGIVVNIEGTKDNIVDTTKKIEVDNKTQEFTIYIPLMEKPKDNQKYNVSIPETIFINLSEEDTQEEFYEWTFETNYFPKTEKLYEGSVPELYNWSYPIVIDGDLFHSNTFVSFKHSNGRVYNAARVSLSKDNKTLYVYLPRYPRLPIGLYDIIVSNGNRYDTAMIYGVFSVVEEGDYIPNEEYKVKSSLFGTVKEIINTSKDIVELNSRHTNKTYLEINLDELMGSETWVRSIEYPISRSDNIEELVLKSKWTNTTIKNLTLHNDAEEKYIDLRVGRVEPSMADILKKKLMGYSIKSNFIEVSGANFDFSNLTIELPYFQSDGSNLKLLRYDELTRQFEALPYIVDLINGKVKGISSKPGIFVIVE